MSTDTSAATWPGVPGPGDRWAQREVSGEGPVPLREVLLWGRPVLVQDSTRRVFCPGCARLIDVTLLGRADNQHAGSVGRDPMPRGTAIDLSNRPDHEDYGGGPAVSRW